MPDALPVAALPIYPWLGLASRNTEMCLQCLGYVIIMNLYQILGFKYDSKMIQMRYNHESISDRSRFGLPTTASGVAQ